jgi:hypothetical protein
MKIDIECTWLRSPVCTISEKKYLTVYLHAKKWNQHAVYREQRQERKYVQTELVFQL